MKKKNNMCECSPISKISWILVIVGALNWGLQGFFNFNLVAYLFGAEGLLSVVVLERIIYALVGLAGLYVIYETSQKMKKM